MTTEKEIKIKQAEDLIKNTLMHEREVLSQLWDVAQKEIKIKFLKEIIEETYNDEFFDSLNICLIKLEKLENE